MKWLRVTRFLCVPVLSRLGAIPAGDVGKRQSREGCLLEHHDGSKKVLGRQHMLSVRCYAVLVYILFFMYEILVKFLNNKTPIALLHVVPMSENLQTENLGAFVYRCLNSHICY